MWGLGDDGPSGEGYYAAFDHRRSQGGGESSSLLSEDEGDEFESRVPRPRGLESAFQVRACVSVLREGEGRGWEENGGKLRDMHVCLCLHLYGGQRHKKCQCVHLVYMCVSLSM